MRNKTVLIFVACLIAVIFGTALFFAFRSVSRLFFSDAEVVIGNVVFSVEIADDERERERGLSGRNSLSPGSGMLFVFEPAAMPRFWMKDMNFPIDIVWITDGRVVGWVTDVDPQTGVPEQNISRYLPPQPVDLVLEVPSGTVVKNNMRVGEEVVVRK